jgi:metacaspase-1
MKNKALLVGINQYPDPRNELRGCINDINDMFHFITQINPVYQKEQVKTLTNRQATKKGIVENLKWLLEELQAGDQILFHYSGHGAQMPTQHPALEKDGNDEIICPYDFDWTAATTLRDKEFAEIFKAIPNGVHFVWISDSCHAEDLSRDPMDQSNRYRFINRPANLIPSMDAASIASAPILTPLNGALLSACASDQVSADAYIDNRFNGAFTYYLLKNLKVHAKQMPMNELIKLVNADLAKNGYEQAPQIEGKLETVSFFI